MRAATMVWSSYAPCIGRSGGFTFSRGNCVCGSKPIEVGDHDPTRAPAIVRGLIYQSAC